MLEIYAHISLHAVMHASMCSLSSHALPPLNPAHAQYKKYKSPNHLNHE